MNSRVGNRRRLHFSPRRIAGFNHDILHLTNLFIICFNRIFGTMDVLCKRNLRAGYDKIEDLTKFGGGGEMAEILDKGPFYHGTRADLQIGDLLTAGFRSNYNSDVVMNHIYFTALRDGAGLAAELAKGGGEPRVYLVEPTGEWENDPNVTDKKFPGNPTRSYRSKAPLKIVGEVKDWVRQTPEQLAVWHKRLAKIDKGEILN
ncbi:MULTISPECIES: NAD(+)--rifampin ADP-ribosyltransferase [unclassified Paenibacillus]|uniref:NAD(+)--rifampin ADP-ribosyltransferase n=1 Tax=unclassified Paenibacillus TaxID=185978 RepID=UPI001CB76351|nr:MULTISPECIES: NAD(+)--rifampin ADP-ribosyltransferase [unclassified Paenibacillus]